MKSILLETKEQLNIYMNPQRQKILRLLRLAMEPCTPKKLADEIGISASSIQYHLNKLELLNLVYVHHTANINGIIAKYYTINDLKVHVGLDNDNKLHDEREILCKNLMDNILDSTLKACSNSPKQGDVITGIAHISPEKAKELYKIVTKFLDENNKPSKDTIPFEYALMAYKVEQKND